MAAIGHVTMDSKEYKLKSMPVKTLANQMAPKLSSETEYAALDSWSAWIMEDWQAGVGKTRPHRTSGGFLYGECETRVPGQIILPQALHHTYVVAGSSVTSGTERTFSPDQTTGFTSVTVGTGGYGKLGIKVDADDYSSVVTHTSLLVNTGGSAVTIQCDLYSDNAGTPNAVLATTSTAVPAGIMGAWPVIFAHSAITPTTAFWVVVEVLTGTSFDVYCGTARTGSPVTKSYDPSTWTSRTVYPFFSMTASTRTMLGIAVTDEKTVFVGGTLLSTGIYSLTYDTVNGDIDAAVTVDATDQPLEKQAVYVLDRVYITSDDDLKYVTSAGTGATNTGLAATFVAVGQGYIWRANSRTVYYSADGTTWTSVGDVGYSPWVVTGMADLEGVMYVATGDGLYAVMPGDFVVGVGPWGSPLAANGKYLMNWQGALYCIVNGRVWRYSTDGGLQDIWIKLDDDLPSERIGPVVALGSGQSCLYALVDANSSSGCPTVWAYASNSWHFVAELPMAVTPNQIVYDRTNSCLWVTADRYRVFKIRESGYAINPYNDTASEYMPAGWIEWDWYRGNVRENDKDWESVTLMGTFSASSYVKVYWKDTDSTNWELLGTVDSDGEELRWPVATRPNSTKIKLGLLLVTTDPTATPKIEGIRVKYHTMVKDWFRWSVAVDVSGGTNGGQYQEMPNGELNTYTAAQILANVDALATRVPPFVFKDIDGSEYQVKVTDASFTYTRFEYNRTPTSTNKEWEGVYNLTLEQVTQGTYSA